MFVVTCTPCDRQRILGPQQVRSVRNLPDRLIVVELACYCGHPVLVATGGGRAPVQVEPPATREARPTDPCATAPVSEPDCRRPGGQP